MFKGMRWAVRRSGQAAFALCAGAWMSYKHKTRQQLFDLRGRAQQNSKLSPAIRPLSVPAVFAFRTLSERAMICRHQTTDHTPHNSTTLRQALGLASAPASQASRGSPGGVR